MIQPKFHWDIHQIHQKGQQYMRTVRRVAFSLWWAALFCIRCYLTRYRLTKRLGNQFVAQQLPYKSAEVLRAAVAPVVVACRSPHRIEAARRSARLQAMLRQLRPLNHRRYPITTAASQRVFLAALARCISLITQHPVPPGALTHLVACQQPPTCLAEVLVNWLEPHAVNRLVYANPLFTLANLEIDDLSLAGHLVDDSATSRSKHRIQTEQQHLKMLAEASSLDLADQELASEIAIQQMRYLALPDALLIACGQRDEPSRKPNKHSKRPIPK